MNPSLLIIIIVIPSVFYLPSVLNRVCELLSQARWSPKTRTSPPKKMRAVNRLWDLGQSGLMNVTGTTAPLGLVGYGQHLKSQQGCQGLQAGEEAIFMPELFISQTEHIWPREELLKGKPQAQRALLILSSPDTKPGISWPDYRVFMASRHVNPFFLLSSFHTLFLPLSPTSFLSSGIVDFPNVCGWVHNLCEDIALIGQPGIFWSFQCCRGTIPQGERRENLNNRPCLSPEGDYFQTSLSFYVLITSSTSFLPKNSPFCDLFEQ